MMKDERKEQKRKEAFRKWARQHAKLRRNLRKHGGDILQSGNFKSTNSFIQHGSVSVHSHSIRVAECSLKLEKFLEKLGIHCHERDLVRGALLHDYFLYDWHDPEPWHRLHGFRHPFFALRNAEDDFTLGERERNIIARHMFPLVPVPPTCREAWIVCGADKLVALRETLDSRVPKRLLPRWLKEAGR